MMLFLWIFAIVGIITCATTVILIIFFLIDNHRYNKHYDKKEDKE